MRLYTGLQITKTISRLEQAELRGLGIEEVRRYALKKLGVMR